MDLHARPRLLTIISNLGGRVVEARENGWLGEVDGLQIRLAVATEKLATLDRITPRVDSGHANLGKPSLTIHRT
jgi:hypothetical protein